MTPLKRSALTLLLTLIILPIQAVSVAAAPDSDSGRLNQARQEKAQKQAELDAARKTDAQLEAHVEELKGQVAAQNGKVAEIKARIEAAEEALKISAERIRRTEAEMKKRQDLFNARVVAAYKRTDASLAEAVLGAESLADAGRRLSQLQRVIDNDNEVVSRLNTAKADLEEDKRKYEEEKQAFDEARKKEQAELDKLEDLKAEAVASEAQLQARIDNLKKEIEALAAEEGAIQARIRAKQAAAEAALKARGGNLPPGEPGSASARGFIWPVRGVVTSGFGQRWGRLHAGIDIAAPMGSPVMASKAGQVIFSGWQGGYGNLILIAHGDGIVTAYAHLSGMGAGDGQFVNQGQTIGRVGCTGSCTGPHLHFEVRVNGSPQNPLAYLS